jgi:branched-chain amino acid transport system substrate-binding protein
MAGIRALGAAAAVAALLVATAGCAEKDTGGGTDESGPIAVGAILDITGAGASLGVPERARRPG